MTTKVSQALAVVMCTNQILPDLNGRDVKGVATAEHKAKVVELVSGMFLRGEVGFAAKESNAEKMADMGKLRSYVVGLVNNHWRKHKALNGGVEYEPKFKKAKVSEQMSLPLAA